jgi:hypothetical protein
MPNSGSLYQDTKATPEADLEEHTHPFGSGTFGAKYVVQPIPAAYASQKRIDYDVRTDENPVYVGYNIRGAATSDSTWVLQKISYDGSNRVTLVQIATGSWDDRASVTYA